MTNPNMTLEQLLEAIELYFDCALTDEQEEQLRHEIAATGFSHPAIDEARAVMGVRRIAAPAPSASQPQSRRSSKFLAGLSIAASVAMILTLGILFLRPYANTSSTCVAYVNGKRVTDEDVVLALMAQNTVEFNEGANKAQQTFIDELEMIAPAVDRYESDINPLEI